MARTTDVLASSSSSDLAAGTKQSEAMVFVRAEKYQYLVLCVNQLIEAGRRRGGLVWVWGWFFSRVHV